MKGLSTSETARELGISIDAVQRLVLAGKLTAKKVDKKWRVSRRAIADRLRRKQKRAA